MSCNSEVLDPTKTKVNFKVPSNPGHSMIPLRVRELICYIHFCLLPALLSLCFDPVYFVNMLNCEQT